MLINILVILIGLSIFLYSFFEISVWGSLFFDRDTYCIEKFRKTTKATDLASCMHNITKCFFGFTLMLAGLKRWMPMSDHTIVHTTLIVSIVLLILDILVVEGISQTKKLRELRSSIERQWHKEKRVSDEHDHEVNIYRAAVRVTQKYPKHIIAMGAGLIFLKTLFM